MSTPPAVQCPRCHTTVSERSNYCHGCGLPRWFERERLESLARRRGLPYDQATASEHQRLMEQTARRVRRRERPRRCRSMVRNAVARVVVVLVVSTAGSVTVLRHLLRSCQMVMVIGQRACRWTARHLRTGWANSKRVAHHLSVGLQRVARFLRCWLMLHARAGWYRASRVWQRTVSSDQAGARRLQHTIGRCTRIMVAKSGEVLRFCHRVLVDSRQQALSVIHWSVLRGRTFAIVTIRTVALALRSVMVVVAWLTRWSFKVALWTVVFGARYPRATTALLLAGITAVVPATYGAGPSDIIATFVTVMVVALLVGWLGSLSSDISAPSTGRYPANWNTVRHAVYTRDNHRCRNCGARNVELHAHHIVPLSRGGTNQMGNLKTLCRSCHELVHPHMRRRHAS